MVLFLLFMVVDSVAYLVFVVATHDGFWDALRQQVFLHYILTPLGLIFTALWVAPCVLFLALVMSEQKRTAGELKELDRMVEKGEWKDD
ncbi:MAG: hypothetical protein ACYS5W_13795 [Planctomycetota bacterium]